MFRTGFWWVYRTQVCTRNYTTISYKGVLIRLITHSFNPTRAQEALEQVISAALVGRASAGNVRGTEVQGTFVTCHGINIRPAHGLNSHNIPQKKRGFQSATSSRESYASTKFPRLPCSLVARDEQWLAHLKTTASFAKFQDRPRRDAGHEVSKEPHTIHVCGVLQAVEAFLTRISTSTVTAVCMLSPKP